MNWSREGWIWRRAYENVQMVREWCFIEFFVGVLITIFHTVNSNCTQPGYVKVSYL